MDPVRTDEDVKTDIVASLRRDTRVDASDVAVEVNELVATLRGTVPTYRSMWAAHDNALLTDGVVRVENLLRVEYKPLSDTPTDAELAENAAKLLRWNADLRGAALTVTVDGGEVTLTGSVPTYTDREVAEEAVGVLHGVKNVKNELAVVPTKTLTDEMIADDIMSEMQRALFVDPSKIGVRVADGSVTLSGKVSTTFSSARAERIAKNAWGVKDVVNALDVKYL